ncbi:DUF3261 domain-containing protein [Marinomonas posidonica]|uniref:Uncharacterized protein n=1 Tax=Marinomonas posidonica (strain CECT 7376 / NCIMB 14433 / IVIA-Po-181) TaxID=491952 RepID=F6CZU8_MARPP|nr:DUF3261 domain-containing protein [Marinomonas posidonica]AEF53609.1 hypothetical protein Mar181_0549 [Marinomonas posidonica IVIA-Po-181]
MTIYLGLTACSLFHSSAPQRPEPVLLAPTKAMPEELLKQSLILNSPQQSDSFIAVLRLTHKKTSLVALTLSGQPFLTQNFDGQAWSSENVSGQALPEQEIFSMMQFALWPESQIKQSYREQDGWKLELHGETRTAYYHNYPYFVVEKTNEHTVIKHKMANYQITINTFEKERLAQ